VSEEDKGWNGAKTEGDDEPGTSKRRYVQAKLTEINKTKDQEKVTQLYNPTLDFIVQICLYLSDGFI
jgi:hypothetical protein